MKKNAIFSVVGAASLALVAICCCFLNVSRSNSQPAETASLKLSNIKTVQASALETVCDKVSNSGCAYTTNEGTFPSYGNMRVVSQ
jgi:hypothetical protein